MEGQKAESEPERREHKVPENSLEIIEYESKYGTVFRDLNVGWISELFAVEEADLALLNDPDTHIIRPGGHILLARWRGEIIGTLALIKVHPHHESGAHADRDDQTESDMNNAKEINELIQHYFELGKMCIRKDLQGRGFGRALMNAAVKKAKEVKAHGIILETNKKLPAVKLYQNTGFRECKDPRGPSLYSRANLFMRYDFTN